jgi:hypothetical protein
MRGDRVGEDAMVGERVGSVLVVAVALASTLMGVATPSSEAAGVPARPYDVNGDGYADLVVGAPGEALAGGVHVLYGGRAGVSAKRSQLWTQASPGVPGAPASDDSFGSEVTSADYNGDGYADVVVGIPGDDNSMGSIELFRGSRRGLTARGSQLWKAQEAGPLGAAEGVDFGEALVSGDFNGDGHPDLAVGAPGAAVDGRESAGAVVVFYGSRHGLMKRTGQLWSQASPGVPDDPDFYGLNCSPDDGCSDRFGDAFGRDLAAGDFDGNGYQDLAVGVPGENVGDGSAHPSAPAAGAVQILAGGPRGLRATSQLWSQRSPGVPGKAEGYGEGGYGDDFGWSVLAGDFNADGRADLAIGAPGEDIPSAHCGGNCAHGAVHLLYGSGRGLTGRRSQFWRSHDITRAWPRFGSALAAGDFDGDGASDLAVGAPYQQVRKGTDDGGNGEVEVLMGTPHRGLSNAGRRAWSQDTPGIKGGPEDGDFFGSALTSGNFGRGGSEDLVVGVPGENRGAGMVQVIYGSRRGLTSRGDSAWSQATPGVAGTPDDFEFFGTLGVR